MLRAKLLIQTLWQLSLSLSRVFIMSSKSQSDFESLQHITISQCALDNGNMVKLYRFYNTFKLFLSNIHIVNNSIIK